MGHRGQYNRDRDEEARYRAEVPWRTRFLRSALAYLVIGAIFAAFVFAVWPRPR